MVTVFKLLTIYHSTKSNFSTRRFIFYLINLNLTKVPTFMFKVMYLVNVVNNFLKQLLSKMKIIILFIVYFVFVSVIFVLLLFLCTFFVFFV